jgi:hypothetical protein
MFVTAQARSRTQCADEKKKTCQTDFPHWIVV